MSHKEIVLKQFPMAECQQHRESFRIADMNVPKGIAPRYLCGASKTEETAWNNTVTGHCKKDQK